MIRYVIFLCCLLAFCACQQSGTTEEAKKPPFPEDDPRWIEQDWLAPTSKPEDALTKSLHLVTLSTNDLEAVKTFYVKGMGLNLTGPISIDAPVKAIQRKLWGIPANMDWQQYHLERSAVEGEVEIRLLVFKDPVPAMHDSRSALELGPFSIGFPNSNQAKLDAKIRALGFTGKAPLQSGDVPRPDGELYTYSETIFNAPDMVNCVGITRGNGMSQLGPVDTATELGGPGYSAQVVHNGDDTHVFYQDVLGMELRSDRSWKSSPGSALGIPEGIPFRFSIIYAKGARSGHLLFLDYDDEREIKPTHPPRLPNRGIGMWTFETKDIAAIQKNAESTDTPIFHPIIKLNSPELGNIQTMVLESPNGFLVEVYQAQ